MRSALVLAEMPALHLKESAAWLAAGSTAMEEREVRGLIDRVRTRRLSRRGFVRRMAAVGLSAPMATQLLAVTGVAMAQSKSDYAPTRRGGGGTLKVLWWQAPTLLNPHFATGTKDADGSRIFYEPLASWDPDGNLVAVLAAELPSLENGGLAEDGRSVTWKLKQGVTWHDGAPFTADDVVFNWEYARNPATAAVTSGTYKDVTVEKVDQFTVRVSFAAPQPFWADAFCGTNGQIIPKHLFEQYAGEKSREAPTNLRPVGTGPYRFKDFKPGDLIVGEINPAYHRPNRPYFDAIELKGGGDAVSAARAVLQTGEYDYAWNMQVEDEVLKRLEAAGKGTIVITPGGSIEHIQLNTTDPWTEIDGERSSIKTRHPTLSDPAVRDALALLVDRDSIGRFVYGRTGTATANYINNPERYRSRNLTYEFNIEKAAGILEKAGWRKGDDGIRVKDGKQLKYVFQTSINQPRQKTQAIVKQACEKAGIGIEIKAVTASVFFSSDAANPDTYPHFYTDLQMYNTGPTRPDPGVWMQAFLSSQCASKANKWQGRNITRWRNAEFDELHRAAEAALDPVRRAALYTKMNDLIVSQRVVIPIVYRPTVAARGQKLQAAPSGWDSTFWALPDWFMTG
jgi:peptide/nickel transport system substrate-binding protein